MIHAVQLGGAAGTHTLEPNDAGVGESGHADKVYADSYPQEQGQMILISGRDASTDTDSPEFRATVADVRSQAPGMPYAHPTVEHFSPLFVTLGTATDEEAAPEQLIDGYWLGLAKRSIQVA